ncbi:ERF family protein [Schleiferilactobacillus harbinensis]|uniref:ERF family protein n=1 Tax=Schleiferilactobacillus harbinensis TaxID=304207 RepID=UPI001AAEDB15|nr:ERF family protein [Schleiferilactobacillus harbinensis]MBO3090848.1 ERF family protein [Schleiferilactobacillus harbinensis]
MKRSESMKELATALSKYREQLKQPLKDANNPFYKSKYVPLESVVAAIDKALAGTGLTYSQEAVVGDGIVQVTTLIMHSSGEWLESAGLTLPAGKKDPQGYGSAITYARRYALSTIFGVAADPDDDANAASGNQVNQAPKASPKRQYQQQNKAPVTNRSEPPRQQQVPAANNRQPARQPTAQGQEENPMAHITNRLVEEAGAEKAKEIFMETLGSEGVASFEELKKSSQEVIKRVLKELRTRLMEVQDEKRKAANQETNA